MLVKSIGRILLLGSVVFLTPPTIAMAQDTHSGATTDSHGDSGNSAGRGAQRGRSGDGHSDGDDHASDEGHDTDHGSRGKGPKYRGGRGIVPVSGRGHSLEDRVLRTEPFE